MRHWVLSAVGWSIGLMLTVGSASGATFYVATNGNDAWSGTLAAPNRKKTDGPFATPEHALKVTRHIHSKGKPQVTIILRGGTYFLTQTLTLLPEDSGLTMEAYRAEKPVLSAGSKIEGWKKVTVKNKQLWAAELPDPDIADNQRYFHQLWINGNRAIRARHPNKGYLKIASLPDATPQWNQGQTRFGFNNGDLHAWPSATNAEIVAMSRWVESRLPIASVDESNHIVSFGRKSVFQLAPGDLYYAEGAFEFLDEPGEWYFDENANAIYYLPRPEDDIDRLDAVIPGTEVLWMEGLPEAGEFVDGVTLRGITFSHTEWYFPPGFRGGKGKPTKKPAPEIEPGGFPQAAIGVSGGVQGRGVRNCLFENCSFSHMGTYGLELENGCASNHIVHCEFSDLGAGGLKIGGPITDRPNEQTRANEIADCHIHDGGKLFASAVGIWIGESADNRITHNLIHDFYYTGISIGWTWGYGPSAASNNLVAFNHVHHIGVKSDGDGPILSDMGGIYTLGMQPGTKILNNIWHDIGAVSYGGWGIYLDEGSSSVLVASNLVYRTTHGGFHQHYGATNIIRNNIFAFARDAQLQRTRPEPHSSFSFETNIVYYDSGSLLAGDWSNDHYQMDWNLYFDSRATGVKPDLLRFQKAVLEEWQQRGHDRHSIIADPLFVAPGRNDFRLQGDSPALRLGFEPLQLKNVGVQPR